MDNQELLSKSIKSIFSGYHDMPEYVTRCKSGKNDVYLCIGFFRVVVLSTRDFLEWGMCHLYQIKNMRVREDGIDMIMNDGACINLRKLSKQQVVESLQHIFTNYAILTVGWNDMDRFELQITFPIRIHMENINPLYGGFRESFFGFLNLRSASISKEFENLLVSAVSVEDFSLDLGVLLSSEAKLMSGGDTFDTEALILALSTNSFFREIILKECRNKHVLKLMPTIFDKNCAITTLKLNACGLTGKIVKRIAAYANSNLRNVLKDVSFSHNELGDAGMDAMRDLLQLKLERIELSNVGANPGGIARFLEVLMEAMHLAKTLRLLDLSLNAFRYSGTVALCNCLKYTQWSIESLYLHRAEMDVVELLQSFQFISDQVPWLSDLEIGGNNRKQREKKRNALLSSSFASYMNSVPSISYFGIGRMGLSASDVELLFKELESVTRSGQRGPFSMNLIGNEIGCESDKETVSRGNACEYLELIPKMALKPAKNETALRFGAKTPIVGISLCDNCLDDEVLVGVLSNLVGNEYLRKLSFGLNYVYAAHSSDDKMGCIEFGTAIGKTISQIPYLAMLSVTGDGGKSKYLGNGVVKVLEHLHEIRTLTYLDISGNKIGNPGAFALAELIITTPGLRTIRWSKNDISGVGIAAVAKAMKVNWTVVEMDNIENETGKAHPSGQQATQIFLEDLNSYICRNAKLYEDEPPPSYETMNKEEQIEFSEMLNRRKQEQESNSTLQVDLSEDGGKRNSYVLRTSGVGLPRESRANSKQAQRKDRERRTVSHRKYYDTFK